MNVSLMMHLQSTNSRLTIRDYSVIVQRERERESVIKESEFSCLALLVRQCHDEDSYDCGMACVQGRQVFILLLRSCLTSGSLIIISWFSFPWPGLLYLLWRLKTPTLIPPAVDIFLTWYSSLTVFDSHVFFFPVSFLCLSMHVSNTWFNSWKLSSSLKSCQHRQGGWLLLVPVNTLIAWRFERLSHSLSSSCVPDDAGNLSKR